MHPPTRRCERSKLSHIISQNKRGQNISYPGHQIGPNTSGLIVFNEAFQTPVTHGSNNHLFRLFGLGVQFASFFLFVENQKNNATAFD